MTESNPEQHQPSKSGIPARNIAEPIELSDLQLHGVSAEAGRGGDTIQIWRLPLRFKLWRSETGRWERWYSKTTSLTSLGCPFPPLEIGKEDRVVCIFPEGWRFALLLDLDPDGDFSVSDMQPRPRHAASTIEVSGPPRCDCRPNYFFPTRHGRLISIFRNSQV
jgi:hypothetical protein